MVSKSPEPLVVVRHYGLSAPSNWDDDVTRQLRLANAFWNKLVAIERDNREHYQAIVNNSPIVYELTQKIAPLESEREALLEERSKRRATVRSKTKANTDDIEARLSAVRDELRPLYAERKKLLTKARKESKPALDALEQGRREAVKSARQEFAQAGLFWGNYNAVFDSYNTARSKAMKEGAQLRFHRYDGTGRLVNQIQGGLSVADLLAGKHSQVKLSLEAPMRGRRGNLGGQRGILTVTAYTGRDETGKRFRRNISFPIMVHRPLPEDAIIKMVSVNIKKVAGDYRYGVTFTTRATDNGEPDSGSQAVGVNLGWKKVNEGLRVATAVYSDGQAAHLVLPQDWVDRMARVYALQGELDEAVNEIFPAFKTALADLPAWQEDVSVEGIPGVLHRRLDKIRKAPKVAAQTLIELFFDIKLHWETEPNILPWLHDLADTMEAWRQTNKRKLLEMSNLRDKLLAQRKNDYRVFAKRLADQAGLTILDDTSYKEAAEKVTRSGEETELHAQARANRVLASPYELRLAIEQAMAKRGGHVERHGGRINVCQACGSNNVTGEIARLCGDCGAQFDIDENAAKNLLASVDAEGARAVK